MRVALISDLHGNMLALEAVVSEIETKKPDHTVCLGDVATLGPKPRETLDLVQARGWQCIMGNHDEFLINAELIEKYDTVPAVVDAVEWCRSQLSSRHLESVSKYLRASSITLGPNLSLSLFHGSPRSNMELLLPTASATELETALSDCSAEIMAGGHTHIQMVRQHHGRLLINPGSVGLPFKEHVRDRHPTIMPYAEYAILTVVGQNVEVCVHRVNLDRLALRQALAESTNPIRDILIRGYEC